MSMQMIKWIVATLLFVIVVFVLIMWNRNDELIYIKHQNQPFRVKPENPGGMRIPNSDKEIYDTVSGNNY